MNYWRGQMDWPLDENWNCPTCGQNAGLEWGMIHAQCRCNVCHTQFTMRKNDEQRTIVNTPICLLKDDYKEPLRLAYAKYKVPIDETSDDMIDEFMEVADVNEKSRTDGGN